jgi:hypothetical protein
VVVTYNTGELVALRSVDGALVGRSELRVDGHDVVPLSVSLGASGRVLVGTLDGRVLMASLRSSKV